MSAVPNTGVLLINLGTPDAPRTREVRRYLREFLSDPRVIDMNPIGRWLLLNLIILPFRPAKSAAAYRSIWTPDGSPLLIHGQQLRDALAAQLGEHYAVALGMRYGAPSIASAVDELLARGVDRLIAVPLFPQYSSAASGSAMACLMEALRDRWNLPSIEIVSDFYDDPGFIDAFAQRHRTAIDTLRPDYVLFSYHGLPERHVLRSEGPGVQCDRTDPCPVIGPSNRFCYRAQCFATTRALATSLDLDEGAYGTAFQSRLGRAQWIEPSTDGMLPKLAERGVKRLLVSCPAFVADCLETLEEIDMRAKQQWLALGGEAFAMVPSLNSQPRWVEALAARVRRA